MRRERQPLLRRLCRVLRSVVNMSRHTATDRHTHDADTHTTQTHTYTRAFVILFVLSATPMNVCNGTRRICISRAGCRSAGIHDRVARRILMCNNDGLWLPTFTRLAAAVQCPGRLVQLKRGRERSTQDLIWKKSTSPSYNPGPGPNAFAQTNAVCHWIHYAPCMPSAGGNYDGGIKCDVFFCHVRRATCRSGSPE